MSHRKAAVIMCVIVVVGGEVEGHVVAGAVYAATQS